MTWLIASRPRSLARPALPDLTVVGDAGMISEVNQKAIDAAGLLCIIGMKIPTSLPDHAVAQGASAREDIPDGHVLTRPGLPGRQPSAASPGPAHAWSVRPPTRS